MTKLSKCLGPHTSLRLNMIVLCVMAFILLITLGAMFSFSHRVLKKEAVNGLDLLALVELLSAENPVRDPGLHEHFFR